MQEQLPQPPQDPETLDASVRVPEPPNRLLRRAVAAGAALLAAGAVYATIGDKDDAPRRAEPSATEPAVPVSPEAPEFTGPRNLTNPILQKRAAQIISTFENSTTEIQYDYAEDIDDGRGITAGRAGFCSGTGDMVLVVEKYTEEVPENPLAEFLPRLRDLREQWIANDYAAIPDTEGLDGLVEAWAEATESDEEFVQAQDEVVNELYLNPSLEWAETAQVQTALGQAILFDAIIQHGEGDDPDGMAAIVNETISKSQPGTVPEVQWLRTFLDVRRSHLLNAADPATRQAWIDSVSRVDALQSILDSKNLDLTGPIDFRVYGDRFEIPAV